MRSEDAASRGFRQGLRRMQNFRRFVLFSSLLPHVGYKNKTKSTTVGRWCYCAPTKERPVLLFWTEILLLPAVSCIGLLVGFQVRRPVGLEADRADLLYCRKQLDPLKDPQTNNGGA